MHDSIAKTIKNDIKTHVLEYLVLLTTAIFFVVLLAIFRGSQTKQLIIVGLFTIYYVVWGVIHHSRDQSLSLKIVLEYIFIGALALLLLQTLLIN